MPKPREYSETGRKEVPQAKEQDGVKDVEPTTVWFKNMI